MDSLSDPVPVLPYPHAAAPRRRILVSAGLALTGGSLTSAESRNRRITGLSVEVIAEPVAQIGPLWQARHQAALASRPRRRTIGAGARHKPVFVDRLPATLVHLRHGVPHDVLGASPRRIALTCL
ncbi:hypothetical protein AB0J63_30440 [Streptosporangium canum]|uniref:hypothetical protein n=1 Tax=Streptosporangium canum TaxID=324952 RepID=UPI0034166C74